MKHALAVRLIVAGISVSIVLPPLAASRLVASPVSAPQTSSPPAAAPPIAPAPPSTVVPVSREDDWWKQRHESIVSKAREGGASLAFLGDSITQGWEAKGAEVWKTHYAPHKALNLGIGGDRTQHVLWRLENGLMDALTQKEHPNSLKAIVVMIGTNNSNGSDHTAEDIAAGIKAIVKMLREKLPDTKILLLAIFPRGEAPNPQREKNAKASELAARSADGKMIHYLDIGPKFLGDGGTLSKEVMPDALHLSPRGYEIWAEAIKDKLEEMMK